MLHCRTIGKMTKGEWKYQLYDHLQASSKALQILIVILLSGNQECIQSGDSVWLGQRFLHMQVARMQF